MMYTAGKWLNFAGILISRIRKQLRETPYTGVAVWRPRGGHPMCEYCLSRMIEAVPSIMNMNSVSSTYHEYELFKKSFIFSSIHDIFLFTWCTDFVPPR